MALYDLYEPDSLDFVKFLVNRGANVKLADVNGDTCLHLLAGMTWRFPHCLSADEKKALKERTRRLLLEAI